MIALPSIGYGNDPLTDTSSRMAATLKLVRAKAMTHTSAYVVQPTSTTTVEVRRGASCGSAVAVGTGEIDPSFTNEELAFETGVQLTAASEDGSTVAPTNWSLCFTGRGWADKNLTLTFLEDGSADTQQLEVFLGGTIDQKDVIAGGS